MTLLSLAQAPTEIKILFDESFAEQTTPIEMLNWQWLRSDDAILHEYQYAIEDWTERAQLVRMLSELHWFAVVDNHHYLGLWQFESTLPLSQCPVVSLNPEMLFTSVAISVADACVVYARDNALCTRIVDWFAARRIAISQNLEEADKKVRFLPEARLRFEAICNDLTVSFDVKPRDTDPVLFSDLLGMKGIDPRVAAYLQRWECTNHPMQLWCDGAGLIETLFIEADRFQKIPLIDGITLNMARSQVRQVLGVREKQSDNWDRWFQNGYFLHVEYENENHTVQQITLMLKAP